MRLLRFAPLVLTTILLVSGCSKADVAPESTMTDYYEIETRFGTMTIGLYDATPQHRDNFRKLVEEGFYDGTTFHRVIAGFMAQGGDPNSKDDDPMNDGAGGPGYTIPAEFHAKYYHKKGAIAAARQGDQVNPARASSGSQFYIVHGQVTDSATLGQMEAQMQAMDSTFAFSDAAVETYTTVGGTPFLDSQYTVFGEVVDGMAVLDSLATTPTARSQGRQVHPALQDQPVEKVEMTIRHLPDYSPSN
jgi:peptidyl-prolyl cis-trans isomerase B (cyclophilin B)